MTECKHEILRLEPSNHTHKAGYKQPTAQQRAAAALRSGSAPSGSINSEGSPASRPPSATTFPAPLVLPGDELSNDPQYPPQSLLSWNAEKDRNAVTASRKTVYLIAPPRVADDVAFVTAWMQPKCSHTDETGGRAKGRARSASPGRPRVQDVQKYLNAFFHGLPVKIRKSRLTFTAWDGESDKRVGSDAKGTYVGLATDTETVRIRARPSQDGIFAGQLNLNDLLDVAISMVPEDAYALLMLVHHDIYEDDDDDFCCGRAYGGSRVAVVSTARYNPALDELQGVEREHAWPASHCQAYMDAFCQGADSSRPRKRQKSQSKPVPAQGQEPHDKQQSTAMHAATSAFNALPHSSDPEGIASLWFGRVCKTASHELGHCFGLDHCVYYACVMQGTYGLSEDARQPPYLCPVDLAKLLTATAESGAYAGNRVTDDTEMAWLTAVETFCRSHKGDRLFGSFLAWIRVVQNRIGAEQCKKELER